MDDYNAYRSAELAELYDAVYADCADIAFWQTVVPAVNAGPLLELGCGTGRVLLPLARTGHEVVGIDLSEPMLARGRTKLKEEPPVVRGRVTLLEGDMTSFDLGRRFAQIYCAFGSFHHLRTVEEQLACLERCRTHLLPGGTLVLDLINPDPAPNSASGDGSADSDTRAGTVEWTGGREVRSWATVLGCNRSLQCNDCRGHLRDRRGGRYFSAGHRDVPHALRVPVRARASPGAHWLPHRSPVRRLRPLGARR